MHRPLFPAPDRRSAWEVAPTVEGGAYIIQRDREAYVVRKSDGAITRAACNWEFSGGWILRGVRLMPIKGANLARGEFVPLSKLDLFIEEADRDHLWTRKNGSARVIGCDLDHGTNREWGDGVRSIKLVAPKAGAAVDVRV